MKKHKIIVNLNWSSIDRDVQDKAYRMARLTKLGVQDEAAADKLESEITLTDEDMSLLKRAMTEALAEVVTMCRDYVWHNSHTSDNYIIKEDNAQIILMMPVNFNLAGAYSLGKMMHAYIVGKAMLEWYRYTVPSRAAEQQAICDAARREIETIINTRVRATRKGEGLEVIVGDDEKVTMYYYTDSEQITTIPTTTVKGTQERSLTRTDVTEESPEYIAVALPKKYTPNIGGKTIKALGTATFDGQLYIWWTTATARFEEDYTVSY